MVSDAVELKLTLPVRRAPAVGAPTAAVGAVLSTTLLPRLIVLTLFARSVTMTLRACAPSATLCVSQLTEYGAVVSVPIVEPSTLKSTDVIGAPPGVVCGSAVRVTVPRR